MNAGSETQVGIYIVDTLDGSSIEEVANEVARKWKVGKQDSNSGILIAIAIRIGSFVLKHPTKQQFGLLTLWPVPY